MKKALIFYGGWDGHEPKQVSERFRGLLEKNGFEVIMTDNMEPLKDRALLCEQDLIVASWTMGEIPGECRENIQYAVKHGTGLAGCHGGMCDAFRYDTEWQFMTGGQWVAHIGGDGMNYKVNITDNFTDITAGLEDFDVCSEQYYMHVDPSVHVLATTFIPVADGAGVTKIVTMPVCWQKSFGYGRIFYSSLGHHNDVFDNSPNALIMMERGMIWAANGEKHEKLFDEE